MDLTQNLLLCTGRGKGQKAAAPPSSLRTENVFFSLEVKTRRLCVSVELYLLLGVCGIICLLKSGISVLHLVTASQNMAAMDAAERSHRTKKQ